MEYIEAKTIVTKTKSTSWFGTDYNMNIYRGCSHGCIYCDSRSSCYRIQNFDSIATKKDAPEIIRNDLRRKVKRGVIATGSMSDPYNPMEKEFQLTRKALELINAYEFGVAIATKSILITRDIDILQDIKAHSPVLCKITITTENDQLSSKIEPHAPISSERFSAVRKLASNGIFTGILLMPILPFITDSDENIIKIIQMAAESGAKFIYPGFGVTLRDNQRDWFYKKIDEVFDEKNYSSRYIKAYGNRYSCTIPNVKRKIEVFNENCYKYGMLYKMTDIIRAYKMGYGDRQLKLF